jgi:small subunit ribosomal protein S20
LQAAGDNPLLRTDAKEREVKHMPHSNSAKKRLRQNVKSRSVNRWRRSQVKSTVKSFEEAVAAGDLPRAKETFRETTKILDQVAGKGSLHRKTAARRKSRLARKLNELAAKS